MVCGLDGLQLNSGSHALRGSARRYSCFGPVLFIIAPSSGKLAGALWQNPQRLWPTIGSDAGFDRPSASPATPKMPPGRTAGSAPFAPTLSTSGRFPRKSPPTTEKMHAKQLVALGDSPVPAGDPPDGTGIGLKRKGTGRPGHDQSARSRLKSLRDMLNLACSTTC